MRFIFAPPVLSGVLNLKGTTNASGNPNYPAAAKGDCYLISVAGKIGGASGTSVDAGDLVVAIAANAGGTQAAVGTSWSVVEHNLVGALLAANNLSDVANAATALANLGGAAKSANLSDLANPATARSNLGLGTAATSNTSDFLPAAAISGPTGTPPGSPTNGALCLITGLYVKNHDDVVTGEEGGSATYLCVYDSTVGWKVC